MRRILVLATTAGALALPATAAAHVTVHPDTVPAGGYTVLDVRVPNEESDANTTKIDLQLPDGFASVSYQQVPGWTVREVTTKLAQPIQTDDGSIDTQVSRVIWTADAGGGIAPGQFQDFPLSVKIPDGVTSLTFKALQTYGGHDVVRWIGPEGSEHPAPTISVSAAGAEPSAATPAASDDGGGGNGLAIAAIIVGALGLLTGLAALVSARRRAASRV